MTGIYKIQSRIKPDRIYIGSAVNFEGRKSCHLTCLKRNNHHSRILQNHYNKYGETDLVFSLIEECDRADLITREQHYFDLLHPTMNICKRAGNSLGSNWTLSEEAKKNISEGHKGLKQSEESKRKRSEKLKGRKPSDLARARSSETHKGQKLNERQLDALKKARENNKHAKGKHWKLSEETKRKMREAALRRKVA